MRPRNVPIGDLVISPLNVRDDLGDIRPLADSILREGLLHPLTVRPFGDKYEIIAGRRRYEACKLIGMNAIPCNVVDEMDDRQAILTSFKENLRRGELTAAEKKRGIERLIQMNGGETSAARRAVAYALDTTVPELKRTLEVGTWAEMFETQGIVVKAPRRGESVGKTVVPTSVARALMKTLKTDTVREVLRDLPDGERQKIEAEVIREAVHIKGKPREEFLKSFIRDPLRPANEIKREILAPIPPERPLVMIPVRIENELLEPLKQYALDENMGDRITAAAKTLISEALTTKGYITPEHRAARPDKDENAAGHE